MAQLHTSLHGTYIPVTVFYLSTNLVDNFFHKLWQNLNYITIHPQRLPVLIQA